MAVHHISHDDSSPEGSNSTYFVPESRLIVDPGPPTEGSWHTLIDGIEATEFSITDVDHIVVTHWHVDHAGLAPRLADVAGAQIHMHEDDAPLVADYDNARETRLSRDADHLRKWGVPDDVVAAIRENDTTSPMPAEYLVVTHTSGDRIADYTVYSAPGHTKGHLVIANGTYCFVGDAVLPTYTPNVGGSDTRLDNALATYFETLEQLETILEEHQTTQPGHGISVAIPSRLDEIRQHHDDRVETMVATLDEEVAKTPWGVACACFGEISGIHAKMGAGEAAAHLAYAEANDDVQRVGLHPVRYVRAT
ncbi:MBL fold metallo-hydrolase [Halobacterium noricense]|uniref:MBL fold metallo-hydrolase n=1 Tax=Halobacterium noricense TaxID=223182 RepID=UPI001E4BF48F|nr:MBL fold metallo-hydrolase [Halobacterium noricense]UHH23986.1 MBL fold metallo-hydrolase [Halobacterium noricense]